MLPLPISHADVQKHIIRPSLYLLPACLRDPLCIPLMGAIAAQETNLNARVQHGHGPAHGLWQFERGGGVAGVLAHRATADIARELCATWIVSPTALAVWQALPHNDVLAACFARLLLWTHPQPLPPLGDEAVAWAYYLACWRPGKPHPDRWPTHYRAALHAFQRGHHNETPSDP